MHNYTKINNTRTQFANLRLFLVMIIENYDNIKFSIKNGCYFKSYRKNLM